jgi:hypothetical protein
MKNAKYKGNAKTIYCLNGIMHKLQDNITIFAFLTCVLRIGVHVNISLVLNICI